MEQQKNIERESEELEYYREAYEEEKKKTQVLSGKLAAAVEEERRLLEEINRIKGSKFWKLSKPARVCIHFLIRTRDRVRRYGNVKGILRKLKSKSIEKRAKLQHGTASFPNAQRRKAEEETKFSKDIKFSILVPLYNTPEKFLRDVIDSVRKQTYGNWELCLADGSDAEHAYVGEICQSYREKDKRICYKKLEKNEGISGNTNRCYEMATGDYIGLFDHDDILHPSVLFEYMKAICEKDADYIYCDEATFQGNSIDDMITLHFKPDFAIDNLRANNYICHFSVFDRKLLEGMELFRTQFDGSQDHDMILRLTKRAKNVVHVPKLLYYWRSHKGSVAADISAKSYAIDAAKGAIGAHLTDCGMDSFEITSTRACETIFRIKYRLLSNPKISILIPNRNHVTDLKRCISSIREKSTYENYEIIVIENNSTEPEIFEYYEELKKNSKVKVVVYEGEFNYSKVNNFGASKADGDYLLLLNNDTEVITINWMEELLMYGQREDVGAVGAKLYYENDTIQHAGIVIGLGAHRTAGHTHYMIDKSNFGYMGRLCYAQNASAVTGACLLVKKALFDEVGGLDEEFAVALNDVDFCLKLRKKGLLNIFTPFAELYHYESASRGSDMSGENAKRYDEEAERFRNRWKEELQKGDPYYNPNFSLDHSDYTLKM
ncbi:MAG: glycosyltransferase family 2 protein [Lachnospiraceae bacterium]|nr:glycosyltransferase family 2 protein [Lachnospiraceae bacterium]